MLSVIERMAYQDENSIKNLERTEEMIKLAEKRGFKGLAWAIKMRHKFDTLLSLKYQIVNEDQLSKDLKIDPEKETLGRSAMIYDYGMAEYAGMIPYGALLTIDELIENKICEKKDFVVYYPESLPLRKDPILAIEMPDMRKITRFSHNSLTRTEDICIFKLWQWD